MWLLSILLNLDKIWEIIIIKKGLIISEGCKEKPNNLIHLFAPLFSEATNNTTINNKNKIIKQIYEIFIILSSFNVEQNNIINKPINEKIRFLIINIYGLAPILLATIGLANAVKIFPKNNVITIKKSITLSIETHHLLKKFIFNLLNTKCKKYDI